MLGFMKRFLLFILLAACVRAAHAAEAIDACSVLSSADIAAILGATVDKGVLHDDGADKNGVTSTTCLWRTKPAAEARDDHALPNPSFTLLNLRIWPEANGKDAESYVADFRDAAKKELIDRTPVPLKIGDDALQRGDGVAVKKGRMAFGVSVSVRGGDRNAIRPFEEALARKIAEKL